jgi:formylglycine-generating enzyme required for sulfatase activity
MHGNVWEWVQDCFAFGYDQAPRDGSANTGGECSNRVNRGGSWVTTPQSLRSAFRNASKPGTRANYLGFRVARRLE